jgi:hypothetical protein
MDPTTSPDSLDLRAAAALDVPVTMLTNEHPDAAGRRVVDVTDRLTPGAKALVRERTEQMQTVAHPEVVEAVALDRIRAMREEQAAHPPLVKARLADAVAAVQEVTFEGPLNAGFFALAAGLIPAPTAPSFADGRAYERGVAIRRRVGKSLAARRTAAEEAAREYLDERTPDAPRLAAMVLAGFAGTEVA